MTGAGATTPAKELASLADTTISTGLIERSNLFDPPDLDEGIAEIWQDIRDAAMAVLPRWARRMYGYDAPPPMTPGRRTEIRQSLGVLDAMFLGQPGVLAARQRITLRMRKARRA
jgi:hypothetical protein